MAEYKTPEWHPAFEEYCETIFELAEDDVDVIQARIAERLEVSRPAVSEVIHRLEAEGLVTLKGRTIELSSEGLNLAKKVVRRHRLAEVFLTQMLGLSWADAHAEAGKWEHVISPLVEKAMIQMLGNPKTCPHGNPIPGAGYQAPPTKTLATVRVGEKFVVCRITEELEFADGLLDYLETSSVMPGVKGAITATSPDGTMTVKINGNHIGISDFASQRILVTAA
ncbi:MAG: metal-dependent transcriptional regulator [Acidimicrobiia bacterium]|nr:metal-dependent transcriptional regulator [Acidimicrobiia bacterium]MYC57599.1 metal-dependent transcriptional regulator [Acidimicrobiia bacterium]MYG94889.1 metal-dependent transcriptional regulator [Acidimicrobiia bacterium]MYI31270.1 metal-dependent transcriptional regulator [Acidimicrobiia bacterium]